MASYPLRKGSGVKGTNSTGTVTRRVGVRNSSNSQRLARKCFVAVTQDGETYSTVDLAGSTDAQAIRSRIFFKLDIPDHLSSDYGIFRTEIGDLAIGSALNDEDLLNDFHHLTNNKSSRHFFVQNLRDITPSDPTSRTGTEVGSDTDEPDFEGTSEQRLGKETEPVTNCNSKIHAHEPTDGHTPDYQIFGGALGDEYQQQAGIHMHTDSHSEDGRMFRNEFQDTATPMGVLQGEFEIIALGGLRRVLLNLGTLQKDRSILGVWFPDNNILKLLTR
ncbi:unnamed protein product, partial [Rhizoctonia solani]